MASNNNDNNPPFVPLALANFSLEVNPPAVCGRGDRNDPFANGSVIPMVDRVSKNTETRIGQYDLQRMKQLAVELQFLLIAAKERVNAFDGEIKVLRTALKGQRAAAATSASASTTTAKQQAGRHGAAAQAAASSSAVSSSSSSSSSSTTTALQPPPPQEDTGALLAAHAGLMARVRDVDVAYTPLFLARLEAATDLPHLAAQDDNSSAAMTDTIGGAASDAAASSVGGGGGQNGNGTARSIGGASSAAAAAVDTRPRRMSTPASRAAVLRRQEEDRRGGGGRYSQRRSTGGASAAASAAAARRQRSGGGTSDRQQYGVSPRAASSNRHEAKGDPTELFQLVSEYFDVVQASVDVLQPSYRFEDPQFTVPPAPVRACCNKVVKVDDGGTKQRGGAAGAAASTTASSSASASAPVIRRVRTLCMNGLDPHQQKLRRTDGNKLRGDSGLIHTSVTQRVLAALIELPPGTPASVRRTYEAAEAAAELDSDDDESAATEAVIYDAALKARARRGKRVQEPPPPVKLTAAQRKKLAKGKRKSGKRKSGGGADSVAGAARDGGGRGGGGGDGDDATRQQQQRRQQEPSAAELAAEATARSVFIKDRGHLELRVREELLHIGCLPSNVDWHLSDKNRQDDDLCRELRLLREELRAQVLVNDEMRVQRHPLADALYDVQRRLRAVQRAEMRTLRSLQEYQGWTVVPVSAEEERSASMVVSPVSTVGARRGKGASSAAAVAAAAAAAAAAASPSLDGPLPDPATAAKELERIERQNGRASALAGFVQDYETMDGIPRERLATLMPRRRSLLFGGGPRAGTPLYPFNVPPASVPRAEGVTRARQAGKGDAGGKKAAAAAATAATTASRSMNTRSLRIKIQTDRSASSSGAAVNGGTVTRLLLRSDSISASSAAAAAASSEAAVGTPRRRLRSAAAAAASGGGDAFGAGGAGSRTPGATPTTKLVVKLGALTPLRPPSLFQKSRCFSPSRSRPFGSPVPSTPTAFSLGAGAGMASLLLNSGGGGGGGGGGGTAAAVSGGGGVFSSLRSSRKRSRAAAAPDNDDDDATSTRTRSATASHKKQRKH